MFRLSPSLGTLLETGQGKVVLSWEPKGTDHFRCSLTSFISSAILENISIFFCLCRVLPGKYMEEISLNIAKYNIHALVIIGGFEASDKIL